MRRGDEARRAEAALQRVMLAEGLLQRSQVGVVGQPLDRGDPGAFRYRSFHLYGDQDECDRLCI